MELLVGKRFQGGGVPGYTAGGEDLADRLLGNPGLPAAGRRGHQHVPGAHGRQRRFLEWRRDKRGRRRRTDILDNRAELTRRGASVRLARGGACAWRASSSTRQRTTGVRRTAGPASSGKPTLNTPTTSR